MRQLGFSHLVLIYAILFGGFGPEKLAWSITSTRTTLSSGYFRDIAQEGQVAFQADCELNHIGESGFEAAADLGVSNVVNLGQWQLFPYQAFVTIPFSKTLDFRRSRAEIGRQLFADGFEFGLLDGVQMPIYLSEKTDVTLAGGALSVLDKDEELFSSRLYSASLHRRFLDSDFKVALNRNERMGDHNYFGFASASHQFNDTPLAPSVLLMGQWQLDPVRPTQSYSELQLTPLSPLTLSTSYLHQSVTSYFPGKGSELYRIFSISPEDTFGLSASWAVTETVRVAGLLRRMLYTSTAGDEQGTQEEVSVAWRLGQTSWSSALTHWSSYGGRYWQLGIDCKKAINYFTHLRLSASGADIEKTNRISGMAYYGRGEIGFRFTRALMALTAIELERNYYFDLDSRAVIYVSHFLY